MKEFILKLSNLFPNADKVLHFLVGFILSLIVGSILSPAYAFAIVMILGIGKEYYDHTKAESAGGIHTWLDLFATLIGAALGAFLI